MLRLLSQAPSDEFWSNVGTSLATLADKVEQAEASRAKAEVATVANRLLKEANQELREGAEKAKQGAHKMEVQEATIWK